MDEAMQNCGLSIFNGQALRLHFPQYLATLGLLDFYPHSPARLEPLTSTFPREAEVMHLHHGVHSRSSIETHSSGGQGLGPNTIIFIVLGVVCLLVLLIGFYLVGRPRVACEAAHDTSSFHLQHSPTTPSARPQRKRDMSECSKIWGIWRHASSTAPPNTSDSPTSHLSPPPVMITAPRMVHGKGGSGACPSILSRPSQSRRVTNLSVATSFSHSHITEEALSDLHASAYDLDGDLETEMLHSAMDDVWTGRPLAVRDEDGCIDVGGTGARGNVTPIAEGSVEVEDDVPTRPAAQSEPGAIDYENSDGCSRVACGGDGVDGGMVRSVT